jgi:hypothetical protein
MPTYEDGSPIIGQNPHPAFDKIRAGGYSIEYWMESDPDTPAGSPAELRELCVTVRHGGEPLATANFADRRNSAGARVGTSEVHADHRHRGLANAMYVFAEMVFQKPLIDYGHDQTDDARALWAQPNRPFGNPEDWPCR